MFAVIDVETTGREMWRNEIIQIATVVCDDNFEVIGEFNEFIKPEFRKCWSEEAEKIHGISWVNSQKFKESSDVFGTYVGFLNDLSDNGNFVFVCHALPVKGHLDLFDRNFMFAWFWNNQARSDYYRIFPDERIYSTIDRKHKQARDRWQIENQKLSTWGRKLGIEFEHHNALADARLTLEVLKYQLGG